MNWFFKIAPGIAAFCLFCMTAAYLFVWLPMDFMAGLLFSHPYDNTLHWTAVGLTMATPGIGLAALWWLLLRLSPKS